MRRLRETVTHYTVACRRTGKLRARVAGAVEIINGHIFRKLVQVPVPLFDRGRANIMAHIHALKQEYCLSTLC